MRRDFYCGVILYLILYQSAHFLIFIKLLVQLVQVFMFWCGLIKVTNFKQKKQF